MDDLISREAAIETLALNTDYQTPEGIKNDLINHPGKECDWLGGIDEAISIIEELPAVPAVPLDKLCEWLARFGCPCEINEDMCDQTDGVDRCVGIFNSSAFCWKYLLTKWMEEQDAQKET